MGLEHAEHSRKVEVKEWMRESWLVDNVAPEIVEPLLSNAHFLVNGGFLALSTPSPLDRSSFYRDDAHVIRSLAPWHTWMRDNAYRSFEWSGEPALFMAYVLRFP